jgi:CRP-like cAMP-binding protein
MNTVSILHGLFDIRQFSEPGLVLFYRMVSTAVRRVSVQPRRSPQKAIPRSPVFDVKVFLDSAGLGRRVAKFRGKDTVFAQGDPAKNVLYIQEGGVKLT